MKKIMYIFLTIFSILVIFYLFLHISSLKKYKVNYGLSFNQIHAEHLGLDWKDVYRDIILNLKPKYIRIAAMWSEVEREKDEYDFSNVDFMMDLAKENNVKVLLVIGQKAPRWPECHVPEWTSELNEKEYEEKLLSYVDKTLIKYKDHSALELWQVENEPFIKFKFGECENYREDLVEKEIKLVRKNDDKHWIMITDSGELSTWIKASKAGDIFGSTLYRIVRTPSGMIWNYDWLPASFYRLKAMLLKIPLERFYIAELQAEPWFNNSDPTSSSILEQEETMNLERMKKHFDYVERIGINRAYIWGVEWWYYMSEKHNDSRYLNYVKNKLN